MWLARDLSGDLWLYSEEPERKDEYFYSKDNKARVFYGTNSNDLYAAVELNSSLYPEVTWENSPVKLTLNYGNN